MLKKLISGFIAGLLISIGGAVFLSCENRVVGAVLFAVALLCICIKGYSLFTGKICYIADNSSKEAWSVLLLGLLGNLIGTVVFGYAMRYAIPSIGAAAETLCEGKLAAQAPFQTLIRAILCGVLIYLAVSIYRDKQTIAGIVFCIPVFILSGFEHSIADMYYFAASGIVSLKACGFIWIVILGNTIGGLLLPVLGKVGKKS